MNIFYYSSKLYKDLGNYIILIVDNKLSMSSNNVYIAHEL